MKKEALITAGLLIAGISLLVPAHGGRDLAPAEKWVARYNGPANLRDWAAAMTLDDSGNIYVAGYSYRKGINSDCVTLKYNPDGRQIWAQRYTGPGNSMNYAWAIAVDRSGNVFVTGHSSSSGYGGGDFVTIKYDSNGRQRWVRRYNGPGNDMDDATAIAVDASGNVYVTGASWNNFKHATFDYATIKYDKHGSQLWVRRYNGPHDDHDMLCPKCGGSMKVIAFITDHAVVDRIIDHLKLRFIAEKPPPSRVFTQVALMDAEQSAEYF
jgi:hypothetical protein